ncbi:acetyltransferase [Providencia manganoxydans]|uniref:acetyltransferase n=1 Tax=Providencia manganoxydans TaxID=2923283 RepID=UPI0029C3BA21|nr:acetyltransferase [Providencia stuartii]EMD5260118.1 acetyltransferase [Providencia stuartii]
MIDTKPLVLIGGGGHASVLADILIQQNRQIIAIVCPEDISSRKIFKGISQLTFDDEIQKFSPDKIMLINGLGILPYSNIREKVNSHFIQMGYQFDKVIANSAIVSDYAELGPGTQVLPRAIIQTGVTVGENSIINTGSIIEHDCKIGNNNHIAPGATLCGGVTTSDTVYIGANATIIQGITITKNSIVGAGAVITKDILSSSICFPNKALIKNLK